jgi:hypothetical protein
VCRKTEGAIYGVVCESFIEMFPQQSLMVVVLGRIHALYFRLYMCTFGPVASSFELRQCVHLVEVKASTLKVQFVSLSAHCGNAESTFDICGVITF